MTEKKTTTTAQKSAGWYHHNTAERTDHRLRSCFSTHRSAETFRDKLLKAILADYSHFSASDGQEP